VSFNGTEGVAFRWDNDDAPDLTDAQKALLAAPTDPIDTDGDGIADFTLPAAALLDYIRGDSTYEQQRNLAYPYRNRFRREGAPSPLGDIINSAPAYVGIPNAPYPNLWGLSAPESDPNNWYSEFRQRFTVDANGDPAPRQPVIYVGANDGCSTPSARHWRGTVRLHTWQGARQPAAAGRSGLRPRELRRRQSDRSRRVLPDRLGLAPVLVSGLNSGGQGIFALDVTDPTEWTPENAIADKRPLGVHRRRCRLRRGRGEHGRRDGRLRPRVHLQPPNVVRMHHGKWAAMSATATTTPFPTVR